jgi:mRNA-degrading endonuclease toxin of MazEF toxin-antitoxin module
LTSWDAVNAKDSLHVLAEAVSWQCGSASMVGRSLWNSIARCRSRLIREIGQASPEEMEAVDQALRAVLKL